MRALSKKAVVAVLIGSLSVGTSGCVDLGALASLIQTIIGLFKPDRSGSTEPTAPAPPATPLDTRGVIEDSKPGDAGPSGAEVAASQLRTELKGALREAVGDGPLDAKKVEAFKKTLERRSPPVPADVVDDVVSTICGELVRAGRECSLTAQTAPGGRTVQPVQPAAPPIPGPPGPATVPAFDPMPMVRDLANGLEGIFPGMSKKRDDPDPAASAPAARPPGTGR